MSDNDRRLAVYIDFENLALGFEHARSRKRFEILLVLERLVEKGKILVKKAYSDWARYRDYKQEMHDAAVELIDIPARARSGKNSADIRLIVDAMELAHAKEHIDTFVIVSGDSDFSPLVSKLKENGKHVIGLGAKASTSNLLVDNCDEFIFYEDLGHVAGKAPVIPKTVTKQKRDALECLLDAISALERDNRSVVQASLLKDTIRRKKPQFNEYYHGYRSFSDLLEHAEKLELVRLRPDERSGTYAVTGFGGTRKSP